MRVGSALQKLLWYGDRLGARDRQGISLLLSGSFMTGVMDLAWIAGAFGLLRRRTWARPLIVCVSLLEIALGLASGKAWFGLCTFYWAYLREGSAGWMMVPLWLPFALDVAHGALLLFGHAVPPLAAAVALSLIALRGRRWLPPSPLAEWLAPGIVMGLIAGQLLWGFFGAPVQLAAYDPPLRGGARLVIVPTLDGEPLGDRAAGTVGVQFIDREIHAMRRATATYTNGVVELPNIGAGKFTIAFAIDANPANDLGRNLGMAGDLRSGYANVDLVDGTAVRKEIPVYRIIRLLEPEDTLKGGGTRRCIALHSPATFTWEPIPGATTYTERIERSPGFDLGTYYSDGRVVAKHEGPQTTWAAPTMPPTEAPDCFKLTIEATGMRTKVATFATEGTDYVWDGYYFRIGE